MATFTSPPGSSRHHSLKSLSSWLSGASRNPGASTGVWSSGDSSEPKGFFLDPALFLFLLYLHILNLILNLIFLLLILFLLIFFLLFLFAGWMIWNWFQILCYFPLFHFLLKI